jgi:hypothetical protein
LFDEPFLLGVSQDERAAVSEIYFWGLPSLVGACFSALVPEFEGVGGRGFIFVVGDPASDGWPGWVDEFEGVDVEWWLWWWGQG